ncbi:hypothetical protein CALCODRAFT_480680 [Calocera cornea HHB12733]|uniref:CoA-dependent acyltransferase n=1 Tax=Calocera cornea HHB12733 TaxID=1353952 RepID=A0A165IBZ4_9BASI|nr:hypothetical protein CALCODRAFT_480680 [Calocera cornea HHB12733]
MIDTVLANSIGKQGAYLPLTPPYTPARSRVNSAELPAASASSESAENHVDPATHLPTPPHTPAKLPSQAVWERRLGDTELSYFLPSRAEGVNDMYLCIDFNAPSALVTDARVHTVWAILRTRHPLLGAQVRMQEGEYDSASFRYSATGSAGEELDRASENLRISTQTKDEVILDYLNGPRLLSKEQPAYLLFARERPTSAPPADETRPTPEASPRLDTPPAVTEGPEQAEFHFCLCTTHYLGDGMALHKTANEFFHLLGGELSESDLTELFEREWAERYDLPGGDQSPLPEALEAKLPPVPIRSFAPQAAHVDFENMKRKTIGGHIMPRQKLGPRKTTVPTVPFSKEETKQLLKECKKHGVTISHVIFALCNLVWAGIKLPGGEALPTMMYSAANLRQYFAHIPESHFYLAVGYFNIMLPSFIPRTLTPSQVLWHRSQSVKRQMNAAVGSKMFVSRARLMAAERAEQAKRWAAEDDARAAGNWTPPTPPVPVHMDTQPKVPSQALLGLSMLGNLDAIYAHASYRRLELHGLTTGSRQRGGAMLLFAYTFAGRLWLSLGYDENGFEKESVGRFWNGLLEGVREHLL